MTKPTTWYLSGLNRKSQLRGTPPTTVVTVLLVLVLPRLTPIIARESSWTREISVPRGRSRLSTVGVMLGGDIVADMVAGGVIYLILRGFNI